MYKIFDLHNDYFLKIHSENKRDKYVTKSTILAENIVSAVWTSELSQEESLSEIERARDFVNSYSKLYLGVEDLHFLSESNLDKFISMKPTYAGLTWNTTNCLAGGAHESGHITNFGKSAIKKLEKNKICIDTAHLNEDSFMDLSKITEKPIFCSHTAFYGVNENQRNLKDYQLKMIVDSGGLVGLCLVSDFICGKKLCSVQELASHIDYFACKFGINNLAIGTDFYGTKHLPSKVKSYDDLTNSLSSVLEKWGYTEKSINKIFFENANNFFAKLAQ
jgi:membrane dipeptidase